MHRKSRSFVAARLIIRVTRCISSARCKASETHLSPSICTNRAHTCTRACDLQHKGETIKKCIPSSPVFVYANCEQTCNEKRDYDLSTHAMQRKLQGKHGNKTGPYIARLTQGLALRVFFEKGKKNYNKIKEKTRVCATGMQAYELARGTKRNRRRRTARLDAGSRSV